MLVLLVMLLIFGVLLGLVLYLGATFFQGYYYTEPNAGLAWQAPATAAGVTLLYALWAFSNVFSAHAHAADVPYDVLHRFNAFEDLTPSPAKRLWAVRKNGKVMEYELKREATRQLYKDKTYANRPWDPTFVEAIEIEANGQKKTFKRQPTEEGQYRHFRSDDGWVMKEYDDGPTGIPYTFRYFRFALNLFFNLAHFALLFLTFWLLMRFSMGHALGFATVLWLVLTLTVLPIFLTHAAGVGEARNAQASPARR